MKPITKRETVGIVVALFIVMGAIVYSLSLYQSLQERESALTRSIIVRNEKEQELAKNATYIETICSEYRQLYQLYRQERYPNPASVDKYAGLPGSASGKIDDCYLPN